MIITIDGPAGSGKSTAARELARKLGIAYLDTGAMYRAVTLKAIRIQANMEDDSALAAIAECADIRLLPQDHGLKVLLDGQDVTAEIRTAQVSDTSHYVARSAAVRSVLVRQQQKIGRELGSFVTEGRDQGSVVFPDAELKFFLIADPAVRARRRLIELQARGEQAEFQRVLEAIQQRDQRDSSRAVAPLIKPAGAVEIDTSEKTIRQVIDELLQHVEKMK